MDLPPKQQEKVYAAYWRPMELEFAGADESQFDQFVRHYLTIKTGDIPRLDDIYEAFKQHAVAWIDADETTESPVVELRQYARRYCAMALGREPDPELRRAFKDLDQIKADVVYPFLLQVYTDYELGTLDRDGMHEIVQMVTSYIFRRAVCRIPTNSLNKTFAGFSTAVRKGRYIDSVKAHFLGLKSYRAFPTDAEFRTALRTTDLYNFRRRSYFLRLLENHERKEHITVENYTIEHILPQNENLSKEWQDALGGDWMEVQQRYLHTLGNLTLTGYNSEYSDRPFAAKRDMKGGFKYSPLRLNQGLGQLETWNAAEIEKRGARLADDAIKIWPRPELSDEVITEFQQQSAESDFSIVDYPHLLSPDRRELFETFSAEVLALDPGITRQFLKLYIAFKAETNFVDVVAQKARLRLSLNILWVSVIRLFLCDLGVFVEEATESFSSGDLHFVGAGGAGERSERAGLVQGPMWAMGVEVGLVLGEDLAQVAGVHDEDPVQEFTAYAAHPAFHDRVHLWSLRRCEQDPDSLGAEDLVEHRGELRVAVTNQEFEATCPVAQLEYQVLGLLSDPAGGRGGGDTQDMDPATGVLYDREAVQPGQGDRVGVEEIAGQDPGSLSAQELAPAWPGPSRDRVGAGLV
jgi:hypothetical protein